MAGAGNFDGDGATFLISVAAELAGMHAQTLRSYDRIGLVSPGRASGGGRRYYRPDDVELLRGIRHLLYGRGYTIKGVQRLLRDSGTESTANPPAPETPIGREDLLAECLEELESIAARIRFITRGNSREF